MGPKKGAVLGLVFGATSFINNTMNPTVTSFVFTPFYSLGEFSGGIGSLVICFIPRILVGVVPHYVYKGVRSLSKNEKVSSAGLILAGMSGALVNTLLVMNLIFVFFRDAYAQANGGRSQCGVRIYSLRHRDERNSGSHSGGSIYTLYRKDFDEEKYQRQTGSLKYDFSD